MLPPTEDLTTSTDVAVTLNWIPLSGVDAGNSDVIAYSLYWDEGESAKAEADVELVDAAVTTFTVTAGVTGG
jgi:hypothetical protein